MDILAPARKLARSSYKDMTLKRLYPDRYRKAAESPLVKGKVVFLEVREEALTDNFRLIRAALEKRNERAGKTLYRMTTVCIREGMTGSLEVMQNCLNAIPKLADAEFIFVNEVSYFLSSLPIRSGTTVIQTWHACGAFKKFGYSAVGQGFGTSREDLDRYPVHRGTGLRDQQGRSGPLSGPPQFRLCDSLRSRGGLALRRGLPYRGPQGRHPSHRRQQDGYVFPQQVQG